MNAKKSFVPLSLPENLSLIKPFENQKSSVFLTYKNGEYYVMKVYPSSKKSSIDLFNKETKIMTDLDHPNILKLQSSGHHSNETQPESYSYLLTPYLPNGTLFDLVASLKFYLDEVLVRTLFHQIVDGVYHMHERRIAHLDLKLENILLGKDFQVKIFDFDMSYIPGGKMFVGGTRDYMAPEQIQRSSKADPYKCDVYSLGIILFALYNRKLPFKNDIYGGFDEMRAKFDRKPHLFWCEMKEQLKTISWSPEFKELFEGMVRRNTCQRMSLDQVRSSKWFNGEIYTEEKFLQEVGKILIFPL